MSMQPGAVGIKGVRSRLELKVLEHEQPASVTQPVPAGRQVAASSAPSLFTTLAAEGDSRLSALATSTRDASAEAETIAPVAPALGSGFVRIADGYQPVHGSSADAFSIVGRQALSASGESLRPTRRQVPILGLAVLGKIPPPRPRTGTPRPQSGIRGCLQITTPHPSGQNPIVPVAEDGTPPIRRGEDLIAVSTSVATEDKK